MDDMVMYKVIPWDYPDNDLMAIDFDCYVDALQYGNSNYGSRYDLVEVEYV